MMMSMSCFNPTCNSIVNLWHVSNTADQPLQYKPFYTCNNHLEKTSELKKTAFEALWKARFQKEKGSHIECNGWILDKQLTTWKWESGAKCKECERTDNLWIMMIDEIYDQDYIMVHHEVVCENHLSVDKEDVFGSNHSYPFEETWNKNN